MSLSEKTPKRITMPGMIYHANEVLKWALDPKTGGLHPDLFGPSLVGIAFFEIVEAGFVFSGNVGTGIVLARQPGGTFSPPAAVGLSGLGWGFIMGASLKHIVYLIYDEPTLKAMAGDVGVKLSSQVEASLGTWGRSAEATTNFSNKGVGANIALSYSQGVFGGLSVEGAICNPRPKVNEKFYGKPCRNMDILYNASANGIVAPQGTLLPELYSKLTKLCIGVSTYQVTPEESGKIESVRMEAEKEGEEHVKEEDVTYVVIEDEIKKENA